MDPFHFAVAVGPLAVYLLLLGLINLARRPFLTTGARDAAALGVALAGFVAVGPLELFLPEAAAARFGGLVWLLLLAFYSLCLTLLVLLMRPRLVIYNITAEKLRPILANVVSQLDDEARWAGESLVLPALGVQLHLECFEAVRNCQLVASGPRQNYFGWRRLEIELRRALRKTQNLPNPYGFFLLSCGVLLGGMVAVWMLTDQAGVAQGLGEMFRR